MEKNNFVDGLVSIIIPVHNAEQYLNRCIRSIVNQDYENIETILLNDGSTDNSGKMCDEYALMNDQIRVIQQIQNKGPSAARNKAMEDSRGEFIFFLDADDSIQEDAISLLIEDYKKHKASMIVGDFRKIGGGVSSSGNDCVFSDSKLLTKKDIIDYVRRYLKKPNRFPLFAYSWGRLFKSSIIKKNNIQFNPDLRTFEDVAFNFDYLNYIEDISFLNQIVYNHQIYDSYASATMTLGADPKKLFGYKQALIKIKNYLENCNVDIDVKREVGHTDVCYTIIQLVRTCGQMNNINKKEIYELIKEVVNDIDFRGNLQFYSPTKGDSKILPILMGLKLVRLIMGVCKYKANKRYRKGKK